MLLRKSSLDRKLLLVTGLIAHPVRSRTFVCPSATVLAVKVISFKPFLATLCLRIAGGYGIGVARRRGASSWQFVERHSSENSSSLKYLYLH